MDKLTERHRSGERWIVRTDIPGRNVGDVPHDGCDLKYQYYFGKIIDRLAAYEDTGYTPEEIKQISAERDAAVSDLKDACLDGCEDFCRGVCANEGELCAGCIHGQFWEWVGLPDTTTEPA